MRTKETDASVVIGCSLFKNLLSRFTRNRTYNTDCYMNREIDYDLLVCDGIYVSERVERGKESVGGQLEGLSTI